MRKNLAYYSQLPKRRFSGVDSMHSHVDSPRVSLDRALDAFAHVDSLRGYSVRVKNLNLLAVIPQVRTVIHLESVYISFLSIALRDITNPVIPPALPPRNSDKGSEPVSQLDSVPVSQLDSELVSQLDSELVSQQESETTRLSEDTMQMKACQALEKVKQLSDGASKHVTITKVMYKPMEDIIAIAESLVTNNIALGFSSCYICHSILISSYIFHTKWWQCFK